MSAAIETTIFVSTIGDETNFRDCLAHLQLQTVRRPIEIIDRVAPMSAALQQMQDRCQTPSYIQVDEDMLLFPHAVETLENLMKQATPNIALICGYLWDCYTGKAIQGVKIYRHAIVKQFPYNDTLSCEIEQIARMEQCGFAIDILPKGDRSACLGEHGGHNTPEILFRRWQRLFQKHGQMGHLTWIEPWPQRMLERYLETREPLHLYALLGCVAGIAGGAPADREVDWREPNSALEALQRYLPIPSTAEVVAGD